MDFGQVEAFAQVASHHSFSRAAEALQLTQPSITARIQNFRRDGGFLGTPDEFRDQVERYCPKCSGAIPLERPSDARGGLSASVDVVSRGNAGRLALVKSPKFRHGNVTFYEKPYTTDDLFRFKEGWQPSHYRTFEAHGPEDKPSVPS